LRTIVFDKNGEASYYITGAGVLFDASNQAVGIVQRELGILIENALLPVVGTQGSIVAWFDDAFLWDLNGELLAFTKGAETPDDFELPKTKKLMFKAEPQVTPFKPLLARANPPERKWRWAAEGLLAEQKTYFA